MVSIGPTDLLLLVTEIVTKYRANLYLLRAGVDFYSIAEILLKLIVGRFHVDFGMFCPMGPALDITKFYSECYLSYSITLLKSLLSLLSSSVPLLTSYATFHPLNYHKRSALSSDLVSALLCLSPS